MTGGTFDLNGNSQTLAGLAAAPGPSRSAAAISRSNQAGATAFNGKISGTGGADQGRRRHPRPHRRQSYTGGTTVSAGTLQLGPGGSLASTTALTVNGGSFDLENGGQTVGIALRHRRRDHAGQRIAHREPEHHHQLPRQHLGQRRPDQGRRRHADPRRRPTTIPASPRSITARWRSAMPITRRPASRARSPSARTASSRATAPSAAMSPIRRRRASRPAAASAR